MVSGFMAGIDVAVSGLQVYGETFNVLSQNISNADTTAYKIDTVNFSEMVDSSLPYNYIPGGVIATTQQNISQQGTVDASPIATNIAITGTGFFPVTDPTGTTGGMLYTRAGAFTPGTNGDLVNGAGFVLMGWPLDSNGDLADSLNTSTVNASTATAALVPVNVQNLTESPQPTTTVSVAANLDASQPASTAAYDPTDPTKNMASGSVTPTFDMPINVIDSTGVSHTLTADFLKTGTNTWAMEVTAPTADVTGAPNGQIAYGTVTFNGDGSLASISSPSTSSLTTIPINWSNGATASSIAVNWGTAGAQFGTPGATIIGKTDGLEQLDESSGIINVKADGIQPGTLTGVTIDASGNVIGTFSNQTTQNFYRVPLANFQSPDFLTTLSGNVYQQSGGSGTPFFVQASEPGSGSTINPSSLEESNVNQTTQITSLLVAQRAYQSSSTLLTAINQELQNAIAMGTGG